MNLIGRIACLLALVGFFIQFSGQALASAGWKGPENALVKSCGDCHDDPVDSNAPAEPTHDHCGITCHSCFNAITDGAETFYFRTPVTISALTSTQEGSREGFPCGLFIPPRLS